jgi:hypothetical protein
MGLGRRVEFDERSRDYPVRELLRAVPLVSKVWGCYAHLDQGSDGACVGFGWTHELAASPVVVKNLSYSYAMALYEAAKRNDQFPGENYEGSSVLGGAKAVKKAGLMPEYRWAFTIDDVLDTLSHHGPVVLGTNWLSNMFEPHSPKWALDVSGSIAGGHCYLARGVALKKFKDEPGIRLRNSWGSSWGSRSDAYIRASDLERLLKDGGEACVPVRRT